MVLIKGEKKLSANADIEGNINETGPVWHNLFCSFFIEISRSYAKQQTSVQLISSAVFQNELKTDNKHKLLFNNFSDKLFFQQAAALPNRA
jgi:hypothetical protein